MKTISLTVPMDYNALTRASDMLHGMAIDLKHEGAPEAERKVQNAPVEEAHVETEAPAPAPVVTAEPEAAAVFADPNVATVASATEQPAEPVESVTTAGTATNAVDLDGEGLPWDARIHASSKAKLAKAPNGWKKKRGVDAAIVAQVEAELRAAMQAGPANPIEPKMPPTLTEYGAALASTGLDASSKNEFAFTRAVAMLEQDAMEKDFNLPVLNALARSLTAADFTDAATVLDKLRWYVGFNTPEASPAPAPAPAPAVAVGITTFPALMGAITSNGIDQATVLAAVNKQGLQALPLLAARPDLIPAVALELGV